VGLPEVPSGEGAVMYFVLVGNDQDQYQLASNALQSIEEAKEAAHAVVKKRQHIYDFTKSEHTPLTQVIIAEVASKGTIKIEFE